MNAVSPFQAKCPLWILIISLLLGVGPLARASSFCADYFSGSSEFFLRSIKNIEESSHRLGYPEGTLIFPTKLGTHESGDVTVWGYRIGGQTFNTPQGRVSTGRLSRLFQHEVMTRSFYLTTLVDELGNSHLVSHYGERVRLHRGDERVHFLTKNATDFVEFFDVGSSEKLAFWKDKKGSLRISGVQLTGSGTHLNLRERELLSRGLSPSKRYGEVLAVDPLGPEQFIAATQTHLILYKLSPGRSPSIEATVSLKSLANKARQKKGTEDSKTPVKPMKILFDGNRGWLELGVARSTYSPYEYLIVPFRFRAGKFEIETASLRESEYSAELLDVTPEGYLVYHSRETGAGARVLMTLSPRPGASPKNHFNVDIYAIDKTLDLATPMAREELEIYASFARSGLNVPLPIESHMLQEKAPPLEEQPSYSIPRTYSVDYPRHLHYPAGRMGPLDLVGKSTIAKEVKERFRELVDIVTLKQASNDSNLRWSSEDLFVMMVTETASQRHSKNRSKCEGGVCETHETKESKELSWGEFLKNMALSRKELLEILNQNVHLKKLALEAISNDEQNTWGYRVESKWELTKSGMVESGKQIVLQGPGEGQINLLDFARFLMGR